MKQLLIILVFVTVNSFSQDFTKVDLTVKKYPKISSAEELATKINADFKTDIEKARAVFTWLAENIRYNLQEYYNPQKRSYSFSYSTELEKQQKLQALKDKLVSDTFKNKTGVCEEYAQSYKKVCDLLNIEAEVIKGYVRNTTSEINKIPKATNHAWNAVKINNKWLILDATWAAGYKYNNMWLKDFNDYFFNMPPNKMFKTHYPDDSIWVLRFGRMSIEEFFNQPIYGNYFLSLNAELVSPKSGVINVEKSKNVEIIFKNLDITSTIFYTFKGNRRGLKPKIITEENNQKLIFINPGKDTELVLFINRSDALKFKVNVY